MKHVERLLYVIAFVCLGWFAADRAGTMIYQAAQEREFEELRRERARLAGSDITLPAGEAEQDEAAAGGETEPVGADAVESPTVGEARPVRARLEEAPSRPAPVDLDSSRGLVGRIRIPRIGVSAIIREGVDARTLSRAVGHVPGTAAPGSDGNSALSAHRDTFFRPLESIRPGDRIQISTLDEDVTYIVSDTRIVSPTEVSVLAPTDERTLTLITCYPFTYVGPAPDRFIVRAKAVEKASDPR